VVALPGLRSAPAAAAAVALTIIGTVINLPAIIANWHFRLLLWMAQNDGHNFPVWSIGDSQWIFQLKAVWGNVLYMLGQGPAARAPEYIPSQAQSANTIDLWWLTIGQFGVPAWLGVALGLAILAAGLALLARAWTLTAEPGAAPAPRPT
jgi:hypothetical protein